MDFPGAPEGFHRGEHVFSRDFFLAGRLSGFFKTQELIVKIAVAFAHAGALRFRGVSGEDGLDADVLHCLGNRGFGEALFTERFQDTWPESFFSFRPEKHFPLFSRHERDLLFDHVEELKGDRIDFGGSLRGIVNGGALAGVEPGELLGEMGLAG